MTGTKHFWSCIGVDVGEKICCNEHSVRSEMPVIHLSRALFFISCLVFFFFFLV